MRTEQPIKAGERTQSEMAEETLHPFCEECGCRITAGRCKHGVQAYLLVIDKNSDFTHKGGGERTQHTPGPWADLDGIIVPPYATTDGQAWIADLRGGVNQEGNARLIAAAPELLEACKSLVSLLSDLHGETLSSGTINAALAAIAKAEGHR